MGAMMVRSIGFVAGDLAGTCGEGEPKGELQDWHLNCQFAGIDHDEGQLVSLLESVGPLHQGIGPFEQHDAAGGSEILPLQAQAVLQTSTPFA